MFIINNSKLLSPLDYYDTELKDLHKNKTIEYFDDLVAKSGINIEENRKSIKELKKLQSDLDQINKKIGKYRFLKVLSFIVIILVTLVGYYFIDAYALIVTLALSLFYFLFLRKKLNAVIKDSTTIRDNLSNKITEVTSLTWRQMAPLNRLYDWNIPSTIVTQAVPLIQMDKYFDADKFEKLHEKYGFNENTDKNRSTVCVQSGSILGNPFIICKDHITKMGMKSYSGSIVISWTEYERDSNGNRRAVRRTQTLTAVISKPAPEYYYNTVLVYGCEAAPDLCFSRNPSKYSSLEDNKLERVIKREAKELDDLARDAIKEGKSYTRLGNDEFEVLFGGVDRNNEREFRLLFTPLAQENELKLLKCDKYFGDDFTFIKDNCLNYIRSEHSQKQDYHANPKIFINNNYDAARNFFIGYNENYFKSFFFDMAPLLSIPLYQMHKDRDFIYNYHYPANVTSFEHETLANSYKKNEFAHPDTDTDVILKSAFVKKNGKSDKVKVYAYSYKAVERVEYVSKLGGDGRFHTIPVKWYEYIPLTNEKYMEVKPTNTNKMQFDEDSSKDEFKNFVNRFSSNGKYSYQRCLFSMILDDEDYNLDVDKFDSLISNNDLNNDDNNLSEIKSEVSKIINKYTKK